MTQTQTTPGTVVGYFDDSSQARQAVEALRDAGFTSAHLGLAHRGGAATSTNTAYTHPTESRAGEKASSTWDSIKNFFSGNDAEPYADERTQGDLANREVTPNPADTNLTGSNLTGATGTTGSRYDDDYDPSDVEHSLHGLFVPEDRSRYFGHRFNSGSNGAVVTVNASDRAAEAEEILTRYGADLGQNTAGYDYSQASDTSRTAETREGQGNIQLLGEVLRVHKDRIDRGEVRLRKEVITETQTVQVPVTREELVIERRAVDQDTPATGAIGEDQEIRIPLTEERAFIDKATLVREEVSVAKKPVEEVRDLTGEVRHEELIVDDNTKRSA